MDQLPAGELFSEENDAGQSGKDDAAAGDHGI